MTDEPEARSPRSLEPTPGSGGEGGAAEPDAAAAGPVDSAPSTAPPPLPTPRDLVSAGLDVSLRASSLLRAASLAIGFQLLAAAGPFVLLLIVLASRDPAFLDRLGSTDPTLVGPRDQALSGSLALAGTVGGLALIALTIESRIVAVSLLAGAAVRRPVSPHEALRRSRQVFWPVVGATIVIQLPIALVSNGVTDVAAGLVAGSSEALTAIGLVATTALSIPFAYVLSGIVLGGVPAIEAIRRSFALARVRWRLAIVVAIAEALAQTLLVLGVLTGLDIMGRLADVLGLGFESGSPTTFATLVVALLGTAAVGSLIFTVSAIAAAPQVVAFVGLTHFVGGLDAAREGPTARRVRWVSVPMAVGMVLALLASVAGVSAVLRPI